MTVIFPVTRYRPPWRPEQAARRTLLRVQPEVDPSVPADTSPAKAPATSAKLPRSRVLLLAIGFGALLACLAVFGVIAQDVHRQEAIALDAVMTPLLHGFASPTLDSVMWGITTIGSTMVVAPLFIAAEVGLVLARRRREALFLALAILGSVIMNALLKLVFQRPRPSCRGPRRLSTSASRAATR